MVDLGLIYGNAEQFFFLNFYVPMGKVDQHAAKNLNKGLAQESWTCTVQNNSFLGCFFLAFNGIGMSEIVILLNLSLVNPCTSLKLVVSLIISWISLHCTLSQV